MSAAGRLWCHGWLAQDTIARPAGSSRVVRLRRLHEIVPAPVAPVCTSDIGERDPEREREQEQEPTLAGAGAGAGAGSGGAGAGAGASAGSEKRLPSAAVPGEPLPLSARGRGAAERCGALARIHGAVPAAAVERVTAEIVLRLLSDEHR